jgi:hypothetical protein
MLQKLRRWFRQPASLQSNLQTGAVVGVDLFEQESGAVVNMEFQN